MTEEKTTNGGSKGLAIAAMVCGIVAAALCWLVWIGIACGIVALVLGIIALVKKFDGKGMAIAGVVTGAVGLIISSVLAISAALFVKDIENAVDNFDWSELEDWSNDFTECLERNGIDGDAAYEDLTEAQQDIYWDCL